MSVLKENICAYVLAGGRSSRMGQDKGLLQLGEKRMVEYVIEQMEPLVKEVKIVANDPAYRELGYEVLEDEEIGLGPLGGIYTALKQSRTPFNLIVSCDMPFINAEAVKYMLTNAGSADISISTTEGRMQPLFGIYAKSCLVGIEEAVKAKKLQLRSLILDFNYRLLPMEESGLDSRLLFKNVNTPEEFAEAQKQIDQWK